MIVCLMVPLFPSICKAPLLKRMITEVWAGVLLLSAHVLLPWRYSIARTWKGRYAEVADDTGLGRARLHRHLHQTCSAPAKLINLSYPPSK